MVLVNGWGGWAIDNIIVEKTEVETEPTVAHLMISASVGLISIALIMKKKKK